MDNKYLKAFESHIHQVSHSGCWLWVGADNGLGYGKFRGKYAHRISWEIANGEIPRGLQLDHLCRVRCCVNPDHLEPVTNKENARRGLAGHHMKNGAAPKGEDHPMSRLTESKVIKIRCDLSEGLSQRKTAEKYGISKATVHQIHSRKTWRNV